MKDFFSAILNYPVWLYMGKQDLKNRFRKSLLGPFWGLINQALWVVGVGLIYSRLFNQDPSTFLPYLALGFLLWGYYSSCLIEGGNALIGAEGYIKQFSFSKQIYIFRCVAVNTIYLFTLLPVFVLTVIFLEHDFTLYHLLYALVPFCIVIITLIAWCYIMAYSSVVYRDLPHAMSGLIQVLFFVSPVMYKLDNIKQTEFYQFLQFNPFIYLLEILRQPLLYGSNPEPVIWTGAGITMLISILIAALACYTFDKKITYKL